MTATNTIRAPPDSDPVLGMSAPGAAIMPVTVTADPPCGFFPPSRTGKSAAPTVPLRTTRAALPPCGSPPCARVARKDYQGCRYAELVSRLPSLLSQLDSACRYLSGDDRLRACALAADAYHVAAGFLLKTSDQGPAHVATDRSMTAALASQDPLTVGASGRIVTHSLMSSGHLAAAVAAASPGYCPVSAGSWAGRWLPSSR